MMKNIAGLVFTLLLSTAYALFVDAESGVVFIAVFAAAPIISVLITIIIKKKLEFETSLSSTLLNKNDHVSFTATFRKHSIIPAPFIEVKLVPSLHFDTPEYSSYKISLTSKSDEKITAQYIARIWGTATIEISEITITDYLGIVSFPVITAPHVSEISIFPNIPDTAAENKLLRKLCDFVAYDDNEETDSASLSFGGMPGYEHREYIIGDSFKKINWKLSARKDNLLVRLDERIKMTAMNMVIDFARIADFSKTDADFLINEERVIEGALALLKLSASLSLECSVFYLLKNEWQFKRVSTFAELEELRFSMTGIKFTDKSANPSRIPSDFIKENSTLSSLMVFTAFPDNELLSLCDELSQNGVLIEKIAPDIYQNEQGMPAVSPLGEEKSTGLWSIDGNFEFIEV